ncbi:MAG: carbon-nitrogen hydrolase family protein [Flavitalea sp.]
MKRNNINRRNFLQSATLASGGLAIAQTAIAHQTQTPNGASGLPREVWIAGVSLMSMEAETSALLIDQVFEALKQVPVLKPDIVCLPETFPFFNVTEKTTLQQKVAISVKVLEQFSAFAKKNNCYMICPVYISERGKTYNAAVLLDRKGTIIGNYKKIRITDYEIEMGLTPGPLDPPVFKTDFGIIGIQICWDIAWNDGWKSLRKKGAEIIFWPSAFAGGKMINAMAWQNKCVVVSCTIKNTAKICDISGEVITQTGKWTPNFFCSPVNLDKIFVHTWPYVEHFDAILAKYGRKIRITTFHEEEWSIFESLSPDINLAAILKDYQIKSYEEYLDYTEAAEIKARG